MGGAVESLRRFRHIQTNVSICFGLDARSSYTGRAVVRVPFFLGPTNLLMGASAEPGSTSASLLERVRRLDGDAWERLCALYSPVVYGWCRRAGLQESDAADVVQNVFRSVLRGIGDFRGKTRGGSFRGWLWAITRNEVRLFYRTQGSVPQALGGSEAQRRFAEQPDGLADIGAADLDTAEPDSAQTRRRVVHRALELVRGDFSESTWAAFSQISFEGRSISEVAANLGMAENAVRQAKFRVLRRLREELDGQF